MILSAELAAVVLSLAAAASWGAGDFSGGLAARRGNVFGIILVSQIIGLLLMIALALINREPIPPLATFGWGCAAGVCSSIGVVSLYRALAVGKMGIAAPVAAVFTAALPVLVGALTEGLPPITRLIGFALALVGVWLLAGQSGASGNMRSLGLAVLAGLSFGALFIFLKQAGHMAVYWPLVAARATSIILLFVVVITSQPNWQPDRNLFRLVILSGIFDVLGNLFFVLATQAGRLDVSSVISSLYPSATIALAALILKERVTRLQWAGIAAALLAIALITAG
ncbi:MAG: DMT family transporter [Anaerolineae bacterium]|nr:DMT family transporter [Anaerolineae bacterium]